MRYLITGITGFAGPHLARLLLEKGHDVHGVVRTANGRQQDLLDLLSPEELDRITFHYLDLKHYFSVSRLVQDETFDGIYHLAAQSHPPTSFHDPVLTFEENVTASVNLLTAIEGSETRFMFCSTSEVYGDAGKERGTLFEDDPLSPSNPYGASKAAMDLYVQERARNNRVRGFVTRAFSHTGPRRGNIFSISSDAWQIARMLTGDPNRVLRVGNLETERVVIDVRDCVRAYDLLMCTDDSIGNVYNVCGSTLHPMSYFTDTLVAMSGLDIEKVVDPDLCRPIDIQVQFGDTSRLRELTGWETGIDIEQTLRDLLQYWVQKLSSP